jgi:hypothetical protein
MKTLGILAVAFVATASVAAQRCDVLFNVHRDGEPIRATVHVMIGNSTMPIETVPARTGSIAYVGDGLAGWARYGSLVAAIVESTDFGSRVVFRKLPDAHGACGMLRVETIDVDFGRPAQIDPAAFFDPKIQREFGRMLRDEFRGDFHRVGSLPFVPPWQLVTPVQTDPNCETKTVLVSIRALDCNESNRQILSVEYRNGGPTSTIDLSDEKARSYSSSAYFDASLTLGAQMEVASNLGLGFEADSSFGGRETIRADSTVVVDVKVGHEKFPGQCGHVCVRLLQTEIVMQRWRRCWNDRGLPASDWEQDGPPYSVRVPTGYCSYSRLYDCANPPSPIPTCSSPN